MPRLSSFLAVAAVGVLALGAAAADTTDKSPECLKIDMSSIDVIKAPCQDPATACADDGCM